MAADYEHDIVTEARKRFDEYESSYDEVNRHFDKCMRFLAGDQWEPEERRNRGDRPTEQVNKLNQPVQLVVNASRQNRPGAKISRTDAPDPMQNSLIYEGVIRHIQYASNGDIAIDTAVEYAAGGGYGYIGLCIEYANPYSLEKEIKFVECADPRMWCIDPSAKRKDRTDMQWALSREWISRQAYKDRFGEMPKEAVDFESDHQRLTWTGNDEEGLWIAIYWKIEYEKRRLVQTPTGTHFEDDLPSQGFAIEQTEQGEQLTHPESGQSVPLEKDRSIREVQYPRVFQYFLHGGGLIQERIEWPDYQIPVVPILGTESWVEGRRVIKSIISDSLSPQKIYNYLASQEIEAFQNAPSPKFFYPLGSIEDFPEWRNPTDPAIKALPWKAVDDRGNVLPAPVYNVFVPPIQQFAMAKQQYQLDIHDTSSTPAAALGQAESNQISGAALTQLKQQSGLSTSHISDNVRRALTTLYRMLIRLIPKVLSERQMVSILGPDLSPSIVKLRAQYVDPKTGEPRYHDLGEGEYDCIVSVGPDYETKRQENLESLLNVAKAIPQIFQVRPDLVIRLLDMGPLGDELADSVTPPQFKKDGQQQAAQQQQLMQLQQQLPLLQQELQKAQQIIATKQIEQEGAYKRQELISMTAIRVKEMDLNAELAMKSAEAQLNRMDEDLKIAKEIRLQAADHAHEQSKQMRDHAHEAGIEAMFHTQEVEKQDQAHEHALEQQDNAPEPQNNQA
jgi:hypothetical protein